VLHIYNDGSGFGVPDEDNTVDMIDIVRCEAQYAIFYELLSIYGQTVEHNGNVVPAFRTAEQLYNICNWPEELPDTSAIMEIEKSKRTPEQTAAVDLKVKLLKRVFQAGFNLRKKGLRVKRSGKGNDLFALISHPRNGTFWIHPETNFVVVARPAASNAGPTNVAPQAPPPAS
jgi:hypothetical protein